jgi:hypothetical protein
VVVQPARDLKPLWKIAKQLMPEVPLPTTQAWLWKWEDVLPLAKRAGELITLERGGDRRVLALANPGLKGLPFTSTTLWGALQYLGPHDFFENHPDQLHPVDGHNRSEQGFAGVGLREMGVSSPIAHSPLLR